MMSPIILLLIVIYGLYQMGVRRNRAMGWTIIFSSLAVLVLMLSWWNSTPRYDVVQTIKLIPIMGDHYLMRWDDGVDFMYEVAGVKRYGFVQIKDVVDVSPSVALEPARPGAECIEKRPSWVCSRNALGNPNWKQVKYEFRLPKDHGVLELPIGKEAK